jgi:hypothetical protein
VIKRIEVELRLSSMSHIESGAGCSVDVGSGSAGSVGSVEADDANVGADDDADVDGVAIPLIEPVRNGCSKVSLTLATFLG